MIISHEATYESVTPVVKPTVTAGALTVSVTGTIDAPYSLEKQEHSLVIRDGSGFRLGMQASAVFSARFRYVVTVAWQLVVPIVVVRFTKL